MHCSQNGPKMDQTSEWTLSSIWENGLSTWNKNKGVRACVGLPCPGLIVYIWNHNKTPKKSRISMLKHFPSCMHRILEVICCGLRVSADFDYDTVAAHTPGYVGADMNVFSLKPCKYKTFLFLHAQDSGGDMLWTSCITRLRLRHSCSTHSRLCRCRYGSVEERSCHMCCR